MATIVFDDELDGQLEAVLPDLYRGERKTRLRAETAAREFLRLRALEAQLGAAPACEPPAMICGQLGAGNAGGTGDGGSG